MPVDQTDVALNLCTRLQAAADKVMSGLEEIRRVKDLKESAGIDFNFPGSEDPPIPSFAEALFGSSLRMADPDVFNSVITVGVDILGYMQGTPGNEKYLDDVFQKVRTGGAS